MKVFEVLSADVPALTEEAIIARLKKADWHYEFADDLNRQKRGAKEMELLENIVYKFWKQNPQRATLLWNTYCPSSPVDKTVEPSFIHRLEIQES